MTNLEQPDAELLKNAMEVATFSLALHGEFRPFAILVGAAGELHFLGGPAEMDAQGLANFIQGLRLSAIVKHATAIIMATEGHAVGSDGDVVIFAYESRDVVMTAVYPIEVHTETMKQLGRLLGHARMSRSDPDGPHEGGFPQMLPPSRIFEEDEVESKAADTLSKIDVALLPFGHAIGEIRSAMGTAH